MAPLVLEISKYRELQSIVAVTAQHREMLDQVLDIFGLLPDYDLNLMRAGQTLTGITTGTLTGLESIFQELRPDMVLVHGDTTTTMAAALAAFYQQIPVGHVEAGLRTGNIYSPFPEEMNRCIVSRIAALHFAPTPANAANLSAEGIKKGIYVTGNTVIDALHMMVRDDYQFISPELAGLALDNYRTVLLTAHRRENFGQPFRQIFRAVRRIADKYEDVQFIYPVHLNPKVQEPACRILGSHPRIHLIAPLEVSDMHNLMKHCYMVMTDSGGLQEEAPALGKPVLVLRSETERPEAVEAGTVRIAGTAEEAVFQAAANLLDDAQTYKMMAQAVNPYGDGQASRRICRAILQHWDLEN